MKKLLSVATAVACFSGVSPAMADADHNSVTVLNAGYALPDAENEQNFRVGSTITFVKGPDITLVADPGMTTPQAWNDVISKLAAKNVKPEDVTHVFVSHHHPDHTTRLGLFPNATVVDYSASYTHDLWENHADNYELAPGVTVVQTPGHTHEDASLLVDTPQGTYALTHLWWKPGYQPAVDPLAEDHHELDDSRMMILKQADWIIPGHGEMFRNTEKPAE